MYGKDDRIDKDESMINVIDSHGTVSTVNVNLATQNKQLNVATQSR